MAENGVIAVRAARILDVESGEVITDGSVVVENGVIIGTSREAIDAASVINLGNRTVLPGLIDCHTHVFLQGNTLRSDYYEQILREHRSHRVVRAVRSVRIALEHGFTWLRDLGTEGAGYDDIGVRDGIAEGVIPGARLKVAGPAMSTTGSYPVLGFRPDWSFPIGLDTVDGPDGARRLVREMVSRGVDWIKVYANSGAGKTVTADGYIESPSSWTEAELAAVVNEAHNHGLPVASHATSDSGVKLSVSCGVDSIEHGYSIRPEIAEQMARQGTMLCPTLTPTHFVSAERAKERGPLWTQAIDVQARSFRNCLEAGVTIAFGTDVGGFPWTAVNQAAEFRRMVDLGMSPLRAIQSATVVAAQLLRIEGQAGTLKSGVAADLVALRGNPLDDVAVLEDIDFVMQSGVVVRQPPQP
jgi:imidazolonepropionase-like amidohydrolase